MKIYRLKKAILSVEQNEDGTLNVVREYELAGGFFRKLGSREQNAGQIIYQDGGIDKFLAKCEEVEDLKQMVSELNAERKRCQDGDKAAKENELARIRAEYEQAFSGEATETTPENIYLLLRYLNTQNWGTWELPKMTIGYACNQYDCDGKNATTIKLDTPIEYFGKMVSKFQYGSPRGHLSDYTTIR